MIWLATLGSSDMREEVLCFDEPRAMSRIKRPPAVELSHETGAMTRSYLAYAQLTQWSDLPSEGTAMSFVK